MLLDERKLTTQIEQRDLPHLAADTAALHQAVGDVGFARRAVAGRRGTDEHAGSVAQKASQKPDQLKDYGTTFQERIAGSIKSTRYGISFHEKPRFMTDVYKLGLSL